MHTIILGRDDLQRPVITAIVPNGPMRDPYQGLRVDEVHQLLFAPLTRHERLLVRAGRKLTDPGQRRIVAHHILMQRRTALLEHKRRKELRAVALRRQDAVDHENALLRRHLDYLARQAEGMQSPATIGTSLRQGPPSTVDSTMKTTAPAARALVLPPCRTQKHRRARS